MSSQTTSFIKMLQLQKFKKYGGAIAIEKRMEKP
jgi:hypothetical protein